ncbi:peptidoglycan recognition protein family protein [Quatrionicoccus australiensis]|uniref:peptidoglycan recognition protein family protein n=1 Tax=Quatrionicoccus australiensis TaxID=138118 RepID=UPI001CF9024B|nr:N-acetylmuramoyl-L-alanine amidase [Quatrionicoccus australiensis]UCV15021.1 N-acetylmuramoyl-L-alanine amidase [Quatrionicoccus australiensis]
MAYENVGLVWTPDSLVEYLASIEPPAWCRAITLHHTGAPSLAQRPRGFLLQHIRNLRDFYQNEKHWSAGPHLFIDDDEIFGMCDLQKKGVHAVSFNSSALGIEVLGDYDTEDPLSGRGLACWQTAAASCSALSSWLGLKVNAESILFHRDDPTTRKSCPGSKVKKDWFLKLIKTSGANPIPTGETGKPDVGMPWEQWTFRGERWCVPAYAFLLAHGMKSKDIVARLKSAGGLFFFASEQLEGAFFAGKDSNLKPNQCTWAPARELLELL